MQLLIVAIPVGIGATALVDLWAIARRRLLGVALPHYGHLGRWIALMPRGQFRHASIASAAPMPHERLLGWTAHYAIGIAFAAALLLLQGEPWVRDPTVGPALLFGVVTVAAPWFVMHPCMGAGLAARHTAHPGSARLQSVLTHAVFGVGLHLATRAVSLLPMA